MSIFLAGVAEKLGRQRAQLDCLLARAQLELALEQLVRAVHGAVDLAADPLREREARVLPGQVRVLHLHEQAQPVLATGNRYRDPVRHGSPSDGR
jgi:hypothetical protein